MCGRAISGHFARLDKRPLVMNPLASSAFAISLGPKSCGCQISTCLPKNPLAPEFQKNRFCRVPFLGKNRGLYNLQFSDFWRGLVFLQGLSGNLAVVVAESKTPILTACPAAYASGNKLHFQAAVAAEAMETEPHKWVRHIFQAFFKAFAVSFMER